MPWREKLLRNFPWKITSLLFAIVIWLAVRGQVSEPRAVQDRTGMWTTHLPDRPVKVLVSRADTNQWKVRPERVRIQIEHPEGEPNLQQVHAFVDVGTLSEQERTNLVFSREVMVHTPRGAALKQVDPRVVTIERVVPPAPAALKTNRNEVLPP
jgi:hypothetical protein